MNLPWSLKSARYDWGNRVFKNGRAVGGKANNKKRGRMIKARADRPAGGELRNYVKIGPGAREVERDVASQAAGSETVDDLPPAGQCWNLTGAKLLNCIAP